MYRTILSTIILLSGIALGGGGIWLATLGGSWFYILLGAALIVSGALMMARNAIGLGLYALTLLVTLGWSLWEVGPDWWSLAPRGALLVVLGVLALLPPMVRAMHRTDPPPARYGANSAFLAAALVIAAGTGLYTLFQSPHDVSGTFSQARMDEQSDAAASGDTKTANAGEVKPGEWAAYGRTQAGQRYSPLDQITPDNVSKLKVAWTYKTGQVRDGSDPGETTYEVTPLKIGDMLYACTPFGTVIALDPETGDEKWRFDPKLQQPNSETTQHMTCRGVSYYDSTASRSAVAAEADPATPTETANADTAPTQTTTAEAVATPAQTELLTPEERIEASVKEVTRAAAGVPQNVVTGQAKPGDPNPVVERDTARYACPILPACDKRLYYSLADGRLLSISAETGELCPGFGGADGTVNLWANMPNVTPGSFYSTSPPVITGDLVIVGGAVNDNAATTSPSGVIRAYDIDTGELVWNFDSKKPESSKPIAEGETYSQNAPNSWSVSSYDPKLGLIYLPMGNESPDQYGADRSEAVEKYSSSILALNAETGEVAWVYQTVHHDLWDYDVPAQPVLVDLTIKGEEVPALVAPTKQGEIFVLNRETGQPVLPVTEEPAPQGTVEGDHAAATQPVSTVSFKPEKLTGADMWGATPFDQLYCRIRFNEMRYQGRFTPPSEKGTIVYPGNFGVFNWGSVAVDPERQIMFDMPVYLAFTSKMVPRDNADKRVVSKDGAPVFNENFGAPYAAKMAPFLSPLGLPCQRPPWGYVAGVDLTTGKTVYKHVNGTVRDLAPVPLPFEMGVPGIGGPIVTGGGMAFLSGTMDYYVRGYDLKTGKEIWRDRLPAGGQATPATYLGKDGRQYLVVVAGGHGSTGTRAGDSIIAYALPAQG